MRTENVRPDAATGTTTAKMNESVQNCEENGVKITHTMCVWSPVLPFGKRFVINDKYAIYVQDVSEQQNTKLFEEGLQIIDSKVTPKRKSYLAGVFRAILPKAGENLDDIMEKSCKRNVGHIIALVCDIALHKNKKLAHPQAYHKDFNKYVANLFHEYFIDDAYSRYIQLGAGYLAPVPEFLVFPELCNWLSA